jgi:hypothetical protein
VQLDTISCIQILKTTLKKFQFRNSFDTPLKPDIAGLRFQNFRGSGLLVVIIDSWSLADGNAQVGPSTGMSERHWCNEDQLENIRG